jgi:hypothetical protein
MAILIGMPGCTTTDTFSDVGIAVLVPAGGDAMAPELEFVADSALDVTVDSGLLNNPCSDVEARCEIVVAATRIDIAADFEVRERNCSAGKTGPLPAPVAECSSTPVPAGAFVVSYAGFEEALTVPSTGPALRVGVIAP